MGRWNLSGSLQDQRGRFNPQRKGPQYGIWRHKALRRLTRGFLGGEERRKQADNHLISVNELCSWWCALLASCTQPYPFLPSSYCPFNMTFPKKHDFHKRVANIPVERKPDPNQTHVLSVRFDLLGAGFFTMIVSVSSSYEPWSSILALPYGHGYP